MHTAQPAEFSSTEQALCHTKDVLDDDVNDVVMHAPDAA